MSRSMRLAKPHRCYALVTSILFLVMLTLVALATLKGSGLEARMSSNNAYHTQSLESSETGRRTIDALIDANLYYRGWPNTTGINGTVAVADFDPTVTALIAGSAACPLAPSYSTSSVGYTLCWFGGTKVPRNWYDHNSECGEASAITPCPLFSPNALNQDAAYTQSFNPSASTSSPTLYETSTVAVYKLAVTLAAGAGTQQVSGYLGLGRAAAAGGSNIFYYVNGHGRDFSTTPQASLDSSSVFRDTIRN